MSNISELEAERSVAGAGRRTLMKALIYQGPGKKVLEDRPIPEIKAPTDAIVKICENDDLRHRPAHSQG